MIGGVDFDRGRMAWIGAGLVLSLVLAFVVYSFIGTFMFGLFLYYATRPVYDRLREHVGRPSVAAAVSILALALPVLFLFFYTLAVALQELNRFTQSNDVSQLQSFLSPYFNASTGVQDPGSILSDPGAFLSRPGIQDALTAMIDPLLSSLGFLGNALIQLFVMIVIAYYLLKDGRRLSRWFRGKFADERGVLGEFFRAVDRDFQNIFFGNLLNAFLAAIIAVIAYTTLNVFSPQGSAIPYAALVGLLTGVGSLIPVVGMKLVYVPVAAYMGVAAYMTGGIELLWFPVAFVVVSVVIVDLIPDFVLRPYVSGRDLHLGAVMLAYTFGPLIWGWYGIFLGPVLLVLVFHFGRIVVPELVERRSLRPYAIDPGNMMTGSSTGEPTDRTVEGRATDSSVGGGPSSADARGTDPPTTSDDPDKRSPAAGGVSDESGPTTSDRSTDPSATDDATDGESTGDIEDGSGNTET